MQFDLYMDNFSFLFCKMDSSRVHGETFEDRMEWPGNFRPVTEYVSDERWEPESRVVKGKYLEKCSLAAYTLIK